MSGSKVLPDTGIWGGGVVLELGTEVRTHSFTKH